MLQADIFYIKLPRVKMIVDGELAASWHSAAACCVMLVRSQTNDTEEHIRTHLAPSRPGQAQQKHGFL